jgi:hypothetical protein
VNESIVKVDIPSSVLQSVSTGFALESASLFSVSGRKMGSAGFVVGYSLVKEKTAVRAWTLPKFTKAIVSLMIYGFF